MFSLCENYTAWKFTHKNSQARWKDFLPLLSRRWQSFSLLAADLGKVGDLDFEPCFTCRTGFLVSGFYIPNKKSESSREPSFVISFFLPNNRDDPGKPVFSLGGNEAWQAHGNCVLFNIPPYKCCITEIYHYTTQSLGLAGSNWRRMGRLIDKPESPLRPTVCSGGPSSTSMIWDFAV